MGTEIQLAVGKVSLSYAKNHMGMDYGFLFQAGDEDKLRADGIDYEYYERHPELDDLAEHEAAFVRSLARVLPRLSLLGHTLDTARAEYQAVLDEAAELIDPDDPPEQAASFLTFEEFCSLACSFPIPSLASEYIDFDTEERAKVAQGRFAAHAEQLKRLPWNENSDAYWSEASYLAATLCILSAESMLLVFGSDPRNADAPVIWQFGPIVNAGWVRRESFYPGARRGQTILVATEGASDARILRRALDLLRPDIADFFRFIDADERHHFWGTGNLVKFAEGLVRIDIQNQVLFVLDNDVEGVEAYRKLQLLGMQSNMRAMVLPDLEVFRSFPARGPQGISNTDINGRAAAIECYLDLNLKEYPAAQVVWSNYKKEVDAWHGALEFKESYMRHFMGQDAGSLAKCSYDTSKLMALLDAVAAEASLVPNVSIDAALISE